MYCPFKQKICKSVTNQVLSFCANQCNFHWKNITQYVTYPCPKCGTYNLPYMHNRDGYAFMLCSKCNVQYKTSTRVSASFRKFCSKVARQPNRDPTYYTSTEKKVKKLLDEFKYREGLDYFHNVRVKNGKRYYWLDFVIPLEHKVIEVSPSIWHRMWNRQSSDKRKYQFLQNNDFTVIEVNERNYADILRRSLWYTVW